MCPQLKRFLAVSTFVASATLLAWGADSMPGLKLKDPSGQSQNLKQYKGKPIVLNFWATWCGPCNEEIPLFAQEERTYRARGIVFIGVSMNESGEVDKVREFVNKFKVEFPVWMGSVDDLERFKLGPGIPATAFINSDGQIVGRVLGEIHKDDLEHRLEWLLGNKQGDPPSELENTLNFKH